LRQRLSLASTRLSVGINPANVATGGTHVEHSTTDGLADLCLDEAASAAYDQARVDFGKNGVKLFAFDSLTKVDQAALAPALGALPTDLTSLTGELAAAELERWVALYEAQAAGLLLVSEERASPSRRSEKPAGVRLRTPARGQPRSAKTAIARGKRRP
jgi:hypothetical protein